MFPSRNPEVDPGRTVNKKPLSNHQLVVATVRSSPKEHYTTARRRLPQHSDLDRHFKDTSYVGLEILTRTTRPSRTRRQGYLRVTIARSSVVNHVLKTNDTNTAL